MNTLVKKYIYILALILLPMANTFAMERADISIGLLPKLQLHERCLCKEKCDNSKWCYVDPDQCLADIRSEVFDGLTGFWRRCDPREERTQVQKNTSNLSLPEAVSYWGNKVPEVLENLQDEARLMIETGWAAQTYKSNPREKAIRISDLIMYHPVRGPTERAPTIRSLNDRVEALTAHWESTFKSKYEKQHPITSKDLEQVAKMKSKDEIQVVEFRTSRDAHPQYIVISGQGRVQAMMESFPADLTIILTVFDLPLGLCGKVFGVRNGYIHRKQMLDVRGSPIDEKKYPASCAALCPGNECGPYGAGYFPINMTYNDIGLNWEEHFLLRNRVGLSTRSASELRNQFVRKDSDNVRKQLILEKTKLSGTFGSKKTIHLTARIIALSQVPESVLIESEMRIFIDLFCSMIKAKNEVGAYRNLHWSMDEEGSHYSVSEEAIRKKEEWEKWEYNWRNTRYEEYKKEFRGLVLKKYENLPFPKK